MKKLYEINELRFALLWIFCVLYCEHPYQGSFEICGAGLLCLIAAWHKCLQLLPCCKSDSLRR